MELREFITKLASKAPVPGGGGASAFIGALGTALCSMVANLTSGKKKYAEYQADIELLLAKATASTERLLTLIDRDEQAFTPLAAAYGLPKDEPKREEILEKALVEACAVPLELLHELCDVLTILSELSEKGSRLAVSDIGVASAAIKAAAYGAAMNVYINTKLMKDRTYAAKQNSAANKVIERISVNCDAVYERIKRELEVSV